MRSEGFCQKKRPMIPPDVSNRNSTHHGLSSHQTSDHKQRACSTTPRCGLLSKPGSSEPTTPHSHMHACGVAAPRTQCRGAPPPAIRVLNLIVCLWGCSHRSKSQQLREGRGARLAQAQSCQWAPPGEQCLRRSHIHIPVRARHKQRRPHHCEAHRQQPSKTTA